MRLSATTTPQQTDGERLGAAIDRLWAASIVALGPIDAPPERAREIVRRHVEKRFPGGLGSFLFWTTDDAGAFDGCGRLVRPMTLHCSGEEVVVTALAAAQGAGLEAAVAPEPDSVRILPAVIEARRR